MKKYLVSVAAMLAAGMIFGKGAVATVSADEAANPAKPDSYYSYVQDFSDLAKVNNAFHAYYLENALGSAKAEQISDDPETKDAHWYIKDNTLVRTNDVAKDEDTGTFETNKIAMVTYTKDAFLNFELSVDYKRGDNGFWPVVAIRQLEEGKYYLDDGAGVFVQQSGKITLWGDQFVSGPYETHQLDNYADKEWHNMQMVVLGNTLSVSIDYSPYYDYALPEDFYDTGYVSLVSTNNESQFRNFRIKALAEPEEEKAGDFKPVAEADTSDSLSNLAGDVKDKAALFEREGKVNPDLVYTKEEKYTVTVGGEGCGGALSSVWSLPVAVGVLFLVGWKRK